MPSRTLRATAWTVEDSRDIGSTETGAGPRGHSSFIAPRGMPGVNGENTVPGGIIPPALAKAMTAAACRSSFHTRIESIRNTLPPPFAAGGPGRTNRALAAVPLLPTVAQGSGTRQRHDSPGHRVDETQMHFGVDSSSQGRPDRACRAALPAGAMAKEADRGSIRRAAAERTGQSCSAAASAAAQARAAGTQSGTAVLVKKVVYIPWR